MELNKGQEKSEPLPYPQLSHYSCYRKFLKDFFEYKKSLKKSFSYRRFSQLVGLKSPNYLQLVILGQRNLTLATADSVAKAMKLSAAETKYFLALVGLDQANGDEERRLAEKHLFQAARHMQTQFAKHDDTELFGKWYHLAIRELAQLNDFEASGEYVSHKLSGLISVDQAEASLKYLIQAGQLKLENGRYIVCDPVFDAGTDIFQHVTMQRFHAEQLQVWAKNLGRLGGSDQELGLLNIPIPKEKIPDLVKKIRLFQDEIIGWVQDFKNCDQLVQLGTYLMAFEEDKN